MGTPKTVRGRRWAASRRRLRQCPESPAQLQSQIALTTPTFGFPPDSQEADTTPTIPGCRTGNPLRMRRRGCARLNP